MANRGNVTKMRKRAKVLLDLASVKRRLAAEHLAQAETMESDAQWLMRHADAQDAEL